MTAEALKLEIEKALPGIALRTVRDTLLIEKAEDLPKVASYLKTAPEHKLDYLSSVTATDYLPYLESVYHFYSMEKKTGPVTVRVRVKREAPKIPSLVSIYRSAEFQEREIYDLFGIVYEGHPDLRRIMMWEGFDGFPMRKDYVQEDSECLDAADLAWLAKHNVEVPEHLKNRKPKAPSDKPAEA